MTGPPRELVILAALGGLLGGCRTAGLPWVCARPRAPLDRGHPLVGRIWSVEEERFLSFEKLVQRLSGRRFVLLGEKHDNPDHHRVQAEILRALVSRGRRPRVAFEMFMPDQQEAIDRWRASGARDAGGLAKAVGWSRTGWPPFHFYRPLLQVAVDAGLEIRAANLTREELDALRERKLQALAPAFVERFGLARPLPPGEEAELEKEIEQVHCGHAARGTVATMVLMQRVRDARMAERMLDPADGDAVLIAGGGHARRDRGVPLYLDLGAPGARIASVGILEVSRDAPDPAGYARVDGRALFDFLWFTARMDYEDPCAKYRKQLEKMGR